VLFIALFVFSLIPLSVNGQEKDGLRMYLDYGRWIQDENRNWGIGRITNCDSPDSNYIIGPTTDGPSVSHLCEKEYT
jgi:hypothetical protein